ncbi:MAG TPA: hypothetical protein VIE16_02955 [Phenylobacterium sp.]|jgi:hypothetical protein
MSNDQDYVQRVSETPTSVRTETVRVVREPNSLGWWVAAMVAIVAVAGVIFLLRGGWNSPSDLQAARDQGAAQAQADSAAAGAQMAAAQASQAAQSAQDSNARAADRSSAAADRSSAAAANADAAARDASANEPAPPPPPQQP